jgi:hypothetical protein
MASFSIELPFLVVLDELGSSEDDRPCAGRLSCIKVRLGLTVIHGGRGSRGGNLQRADMQKGLIVAMLRMVTEETEARLKSMKGDKEHICP